MKRFRSIYFYNYQLPLAPPPSELPPPKELPLSNEELPLPDDEELKLSGDDDEKLSPLLDELLLD